jgi:hypothetical protein
LGTALYLSRATAQLTRQTHYLGRPLFSATSAQGTRFLKQLLISRIHNYKFNHSATPG